MKESKKTLKSVVERIVNTGTPHRVSYILRKARKETGHKYSYGKVLRMARRLGFDTYVLSSAVFVFAWAHKL